MDLPSTVLAEIARARREAGLVGVTEVQAAWLLRDLAEIRALPEAESAAVVPSPRRPLTRIRIRVLWWTSR